MKLYAIKDIKSDLFVNKNNNLEELGVNTRLFPSKTAAMRAIEYTNEDLNLVQHPISDNIVWGILEAKYKKERWFLAISYDEFRKTELEIKLKIVRVDLHAEE